MSHRPENWSLYLDLHREPCHCHSIVRRDDQQVSDSSAGERVRSSTSRELGSLKETMVWKQLMGTRGTPILPEVSRLWKYKHIPSEGSAEHMLTSDNKQFSFRKRKLRKYSENVQNIKEYFDQGILGAWKKEGMNEKLGQRRRHTLVYLSVWRNFHQRCLNYAKATKLGMMISPYQSLVQLRILKCHQMPLQPQPKGYWLGLDPDISFPHCLLLTYSASIYWVPILAMPGHRGLEYISELNR